jgi:hypothetical protein
MAKRLSAVKKRQPTKVLPTVKETEALSLPSTIQTVRVFRSKNTVTTVNGVDDIDVRDGSLLLLKRDSGRGETCMIVFGPGQWITANVEPL